MTARRVLTRLFTLGILCGCGDATSPTPPATPPSALLVLNGLGETLDRIDLDTGDVEHNVLSLGSVPNAMAADPAADRLFVANSFDNSVWEIRTSTLEIDNVIELGPNSNPFAVIPSGAGQLAVSNWLAADVAMIDVASGAVTSRVGVGRTPQALLHHGAGLFVTVIDFDLSTNRYGPGRLVRISAGDTTSVTVGTNPQDIVEALDGRLHVICTGNYGAYEPASTGTVWIVDPEAMSVAGMITLGGTPGNAVQAGASTYVSAFFGGLMKYDSGTGGVTRGFNNPVLNFTGLGGMAADPERQRLYIAGFDDDLIYVVDSSADTLITAWPVGDGPLALELVRAP